MLPTKDYFSMNDKKKEVIRMVVQFVTSLLAVLLGINL